MGKKQIVHRQRQEVLESDSISCFFLYVCGVGMFSLYLSALFHPLSQNLHMWQFGSLAYFKLAVGVTVRTVVVSAPPCDKPEPRPGVAHWGGSNTLESECRNSASPKWMK